MIFFSIPLVVLFYMLGGQINKLFRPIGVSLSMYLLSLHHPLIALPVLLYGGLLLIGYGENSKLMKWLKSEQAVRIVIGLLVSIPVLIITFITRKWIIGGLGIVAIVACSCIRLGAWGKIGKYDILPVDIIRGAVLSLVISLLIF